MIKYEIVNDSDEEMDDVSGSLADDLSRMSIVLPTSPSSERLETNALVRKDSTDRPEKKQPRVAQVRHTAV